MIVHNIGVMPDNVHLAVSIPPRIALATFVRQLKGSSSHLLNHDGRGAGGSEFAWQAEYGVISFGERSLTDVVSYVENQARHHAEHVKMPLFELTDRRESPSFGNDTGAHVLSPGGTS